MKRTIAVVNRTNLKNYGSILQVYALCEAINNLGYQSVVVWEDGGLSRNLDIRPKKIICLVIKLLLHPQLIWPSLKMAREVRRKTIDSNKVALFNQFVESSFKRRFYTSKGLKTIAKSNEYSKFVCGSDQIWCSTTLYVDPLMYLRFAPIEKRIAYAPSIGRDYVPHYNERVMRRYINDIPFVSIREQQGKSLIKKLTGRDVPVVLDPTLLLSREQWNKIAIPTDRKNYILLYFLDAPSETMVNKVVDLAIKGNLSLVCLGVHIHDRSNVEIINIVAGPNEFLGLIDGSELVVTDSYHGMLFAINYEKRFWSVARHYEQYDQSSRQISILSILGIRNRYISDTDSISMDEIPYESVKSVLELERDASMRYLQNALFS